MGLASGTLLGSYEITELLGVGGMGEVYRARDTKLNRDIALKVLPDSFAADPDRLTRFSREAQVLASLNHPNIAQIYGLEQLGGHAALVMELVRGETLAARLARGALPVEEALTLAGQITEALENAHEEHIVHRDLKPANIALRTDGVVKVLDFGLAKALESSGSGQPIVPMSPTITSPATQAGMILGTAAYMAPEQARGKAADRRADIWAFGCVLFEMLTGHRAFDSDDLSSTLAKVLERDPDFTLLPQDLPPHAEQTLRLCLRKDPQARLSDMRDVRLALGGAFTVATGANTAAASMRWRSLLYFGLGVSVLVAAGWFGGVIVRPATDSPPEPVRLSVVLPPDHPYGSVSSPSLGVGVSPDGRRIVMALRMEGLTALHQRTLSGGAIEEIPGTEGGVRPAFSPDGAAVAFLTDKALKTVGFDRGLPKTLVTGVGKFDSVLWRGNEIVYTNAARGEVWRIPAAGGTPQRIATPEDTVSALVAVQDRSDILCGVRVKGLERIDILDASTGQSAVLLENARPVGHTASGYLIFERDRLLMAAAYDAARRKVGPPSPVLRGFAYDSGLRVPQVAVSASGSLVYVVDVPTPPPTLQWVDSSGTLSAAGELPTRSSAVDLSSTAALAVVAVAASPRHVLLWDMRRRVPTGLKVAGLTPRWHPDGRRFAVGRGNQLVLVDAEDGSETVLSSHQDGALRSPSFSSDGSMLAYVVTRGSVSDIYARMPGSSAPQAVLATDTFEHSPALSPDGKWLAYVEGGAGADAQVYIARFPSGSARRRVTTNGGNQPLWRPDGRALFYRENRAADQAGPTIELRVVSVEPGDTLTLGVPRALFPVVSPSAPLVSNTFHNEGAAYAAAPDGRRFLMVYQPRARPLTEIAVVQNWGTELRRSVLSN